MTAIDRLREEIIVGRERYDYRCQGGHAFAAPPDENGHPWATLVCALCGATAVREFTSSEEALSSLGILYQAARALGGGAVGTDSYSVSVRREDHAALAAAVRRVEAAQ